MATYTENTLDNFFLKKINSNHIIVTKEIDDQDNVGWLDETL